MIEMIAYISIPYAPESLTTQNEALIRLNRAIARFSRVNPTYTCVSALYSVYKNPFANGMFTRKEVYGVSKILIDSADLVVVLREPGWTDCDLVMNEAAYAAVSNKTLIYIDNLELQQ